MLPMLDTSHSPIGPCRPLGQSPFGDNFRHASTAFLSSDFDCGEKTALGRGLLCSDFDCGEKSAVGRGLLCSDFDCVENAAVGRGLLISGFDCVEKTAVGRGEVGLAEGETVNVPVHSFRNIDTPEPVNISILLAFEFTQITRQSCCLNDVACQNM